MSPPPSNAPLAIAMAVLVLCCVVAIVLIPILDEALRRQIEKHPHLRIQSDPGPSRICRFLWRRARG